jgi:hypothetical protein
MAITINHQTNDISATGGSMTIDGSSAGASTTFNTVGTYCYGRPANNTVYAAGNTASGVYAVKGNQATGAPFYRSDIGGWQRVGTLTATSGTWRNMGGDYGITGAYARGFTSLWVRIS